MPNFRLEWLHVNESTGDIIDIVEVEKHTLTDNTHHTFTPPGKTRRHGKKFVARICYTGANLFIRAVEADADDVSSDTGYRFRAGMNAEGTPQPDHNVRFEVEAGEVLQVLYTEWVSFSYSEST